VWFLRIQPGRNPVTHRERQANSTLPPDQLPDHRRVGGADRKGVPVLTANVGGLLPTQVVAVAFHPEQLATPGRSEPGRGTFVCLKLWQLQALSWFVRRL